TGTTSESTRRSTRRRIQRCSSELASRSCRWFSPAATNVLEGDMLAQTSFGAGALRRLLVIDLDDADGRRRLLLAATDAHPAPDRGGIQVQHLADAQEGERPPPVVAADPPQALPQDRSPLRGLWGVSLAAHADRVLEDRSHQALLARPGGTALESRKEL